MIDLTINTVSISRDTGVTCKRTPTHLHTTFLKRVNKS